MKRDDVALLQIVPNNCIIKTDSVVVKTFKLKLSVLNLKNISIQNPTSALVVFWNTIKYPDYAQWLVSPAGFFRCSPSKWRRQGLFGKSGIPVLYTFAGFLREET